MTQDEKWMLRYNEVIDFIEVNEVPGDRSEVNPKVWTVKQ